MCICTVISTGISIFLFPLPLPNRSRAIPPVFAANGVCPSSPIDLIRNPDAVGLIYGQQIRIIPQYLHG